DGPCDPGRAAAKGRRPALAVPAGTQDHVVVVRQRSNLASHLITRSGPCGVGADEAIGSGDGARDPGRATGPGRRATIIIPAGAADHVVAIFQSGDVISHPVT